MPGGCPSRGRFRYDRYSSRGTQRQRPPLWAAQQLERALRHSALLRPAAALSPEAPSPLVRNRRTTRHLRPCEPPFWRRRCNPLACFLIGVVCRTTNHAMLQAPGVAEPDGETIALATPLLHVLSACRKSDLAASTCIESPLNLGMADKANNRKSGDVSSSKRCPQVLPRPGPTMNGVWTSSPRDCLRQGGGGLRSKAYTRTRTPRHARTSSELATLPPGAPRVRVMARST